MIFEVRYPKITKILGEGKVFVNGEYIGKAHGATLEIEEKMFIEVLDNEN